MKGDTIDYVQSCPTCQLNKSENISYPRLLKPLPILDMAFQHLTIDFIEGLPKFEGKDTILVVVDKLTKTVVQFFLDHIFKLHGLPLVIIINRDIIFTRQLWQDLFKSLNVKLKFSGAYHPQIDGQSERVN
jgi:hypothetical protein